MPGALADKNRVVNMKMPQVYLDINSEIWVEMPEVQIWIRIG
jgi:hypothetical protein